jgi:hypothetical protein
MVRKLLLTTIAFVVLAAAPAAAQYPDIVVQPGKVVPGGTVTVSGKGCPPGSTVVITMKKAPAAAPASLPTGGSDEQVSRAASAAGATRLIDLAVGEVVATVTADQDGNFNASFKVPPHATPGFYDVIAECDGIVQSQRIEVLGQTVVPPGDGGGAQPDGEIVRTGSNLNGVGLVGAALLAIGGLVLLASRKRRSADA